MVSATGDAEPGDASPVRVEPGTAVPHQFDVVVANLFDSPADYPDGPARMTISQETIDKMLTDAADWWSEHTGLVFDFSVDTRYVAINTTCEATLIDAFGAFGVNRWNTDYYTSSNRDLLVFPTNKVCAGLGGAALSWADPPNVFAGGVFEVLYFEGGDPVAYPQNRTAVLAHEFGHTIGLDHSNLTDCTAVVPPGEDQVGPSWDGTHFIPQRCYNIEGGDNYTLMSMVGSGGLAGVTLNLMQRWLLGIAWDGNGAVVLEEPGVDQIITLARADQTSSPLPKGIVIPGNSELGIDGTMTVEYRPDGAPLLRDAAGIYLVQLDGTYPQRLLPAGALPSNNPSTNLVMRPGDSYVSADGAVRVAVVSLSETQATLRVQLNAPGIRGALWIKQDADQLTAVHSYPGTKGFDVAYQWFRNGLPIAGAIQRSYTPSLPDPNAVFRVEATLVAPGFGPTTRSSRGIIPDDHRFTVSGSTATYVFVDQNGQPIDCASTMALTVRSAATGSMILDTAVATSRTSELGVCQSPLPLDLTGHFQVLARALDEPEAAMFWQEQVLSVAVLGAGAGAVLQVGQDLMKHPGADLPWLMAEDDYPVLATVAVTNSDGKPAAGVAVQFNVSPGLVATPEVALTGGDGLAQAKVSWDPATAPPATCIDLTIEAALTGLPVAGSPGLVQVCGQTNGHLKAWYEGDLTTLADVTESVVLHLRAWDETGDPIVDQADSWKVTFSPDLGSVGFGQEQACGGHRITGLMCDAPVWNEADQDYTVVFRSADVLSGLVFILLQQGDLLESFSLEAPLQFVTGPPAWTSYRPIEDEVFASAAGICADGEPGEAHVWLKLLDASWHVINDRTGPLRLTLPEGSPLVFTSDPEPWPNPSGEYRVDVMSPVSGHHTMTVSVVDGSFTELLELDFLDGAPDPVASVVTVSDGTRLANGEDPHQVTATLVSVCHAPISRSGVASQLQLDIRHAAGGALEPLVKTTPFEQDAAAPSTYRAELFSTRSGVYDVIVNQRRSFLGPEGPVWDLTKVNPEPVQVQFVAGPSASAALTASVDVTRVANGVDQHSGEVVVLDRFGHPMEGAEVAFAVTGSAQIVGAPAPGNTLVVETSAMGVARVAVTSTAPGKVALTAALPADGDVAVAGSPAELVFVQRPVDLDQSTISTDRSVVEANRADWSARGYLDKAVVTVTLRDAAGLNVVDPLLAVKVVADLTGVVVDNGGVATNNLGGTYSVGVSSSVAGPVTFGFTVDDGASPNRVALEFVLTPAVPVLAHPMAAAGALGGTAQPHHTVEVLAGANKVCQTVAGATGQWACAFASPLAHGQVLSVRASNLEHLFRAKDTSAAELAKCTFTSAPASITVKATQPVLTVLPSDGSRIAGTGDPGDDITVRSPSGSLVCQTKVGSNGRWFCRPSRPLPEGDSVVVTATDLATNQVLATWRIGLPRLTVGLPKAKAGQLQQVTGHNLQPGEQVQATMHSSPFAIGTRTADANGQATWSYTIPAGTALGQHSVVLVGSVSGPIQVSFEVVGTGATKAPPKSPPGTINSPPPATDPPKAATDPPKAATDPSKAATGSATTGSLAFTGGGPDHRAFQWVVLLVAVGAGLAAYARQQRRRRADST